MTNRIYAYTVVGKDDIEWERTVGQTRRTGIGQIKVGETTLSSARRRIKQQLGTAYPRLEGVSILIDDVAVRDDGTEFRDFDVHKALVAAGVKRDQEWFEAELDEVRAAIATVRTRREYDARRTETWGMRPEQQQAVEVTAAYFREHAGDTKPPKFLWNAKMRFGKTFTTYQLAREMDWTRVLVLTFKPAVQSAWRDDLISHVNFRGWHFIDRDTPVDRADELLDGPAPVVRFASFQDLNGKSADGQVKAHNESIHLTDWDCIVLDEYHYGAWRDTARSLYDPTDSDLAELEEPDEAITNDYLDLSTHQLLYLSGTPFRALTQGEFTEDAVFNWTYIDEQREKNDWDETEAPNPYLELPAMEMYSYKIGPDAAATAADGEFTDFNLSQYFKAKRVDPSSNGFGSGSFVFQDEQRVSEFLEVIRGKLSDQMRMGLVSGQKAPFPYEDPRFAEAIRHAVWYLPDVGSCIAMKDMLDQHRYFRDFEVVVAAGNRVGPGAQAKPPVETAIGLADRNGKPGSITLSCGKLMTGVTIPQWGSILMLLTLDSAESYFQAAFRVQSPWAHRDAEGKLEIHKPRCFVFEFDPNRALRLVAEYGIRLASSGETTAKDVIEQMLNYLPIFAFDGGTMLPLDASEVMDWATAKIGATTLARKWNSPALVEVNEHTLTAVLNHPELMEALAQVEDFRVLIDNAEKVVTAEQAIKKAKRHQGGHLDDEQRKQQAESAKLRKEIRAKLQKFLAKIPVFMYVTDFREEALKHVIQSLDTALFERVTGLTIKDFRTLSQLGLFNKQNMDAAIWQFRSFERASLHYADQSAVDAPATRIGLWDETIELADEVMQAT